MGGQVVVALDGTEPAERAIPVGVALARALGTGLRLVRPAADDPVEGAAMAAEYLAAVRRHLAGSGIPLSGLVLASSDAAALAGAAGADDLLVVAAASDTQGAIDALAVALAASTPVVVVGPLTGPLRDR